MQVRVVGEGEWELYSRKAASQIGRAKLGRGSAPATILQHNGHFPGQKLPFLTPFAPHAAHVTLFAMHFKKQRKAYPSLLLGTR
jgi:hypothetical protein